jgi:hypothetical protein
VHVRGDALVSFAGRPMPGIATTAGAFRGPCSCWGWCGRVSTEGGHPVTAPLPGPARYPCGCSSEKQLTGGCEARSPSGHFRPDYWKLRRWFARLLGRALPPELQGAEKPRCGRDGCRTCGELENLAPCSVCRRPICPAHRASPGTISDYMCTEGDCMVRALFGTTG